MRQWFSDRYNTARDALTLTRVLAIPLVFAFATGAAATSEMVAQWLSDGAASMLLGAPPWAWGLIASALLLSWFMLEYAVRLRREIAPRVRASFSAREAGITWAIERQIDGHGRQVGLEWKATYVRFRVEALGKKPVRDCTAHLIGLWKIESDGVLQQIDLPHVMGTGAPFDVFPYAHRMIDFLRCNETDNQLHPTIPWPFHLEHIFTAPATYRFRFAVEGESVSEILTVDVHWTGAWNAITAEQVADPT